MIADEYTSGQLRKRKTSIPQTMFPEVKSSSSSSSSSWKQDDGAYYQFQNKLRSRFKSIVFTNENLESDEGVITSQISDFSCPLNELVKFEDDNAKFSFTESILILEYTIGAAKKKQVYRLKIVMIFIWLIFMLSSSLFVLQHFERYNQMLHAFLRIN
jgi:hypothetical protein